MSNDLGRINRPEDIMYESSRAVLFDKRLRFFNELCHIGIRVNYAAHRQDSEPIDLVLLRVDRDSKNRATSI